MEPQAIHLGNGAYASIGLGVSDLKHTKRSRSKGFKGGLARRV